MTALDTRPAPTWVAVVLALIVGMLVGAVLVMVLQGGRTCETRTSNAGVTLTEVCTRDVTP